MKTYWEVLNSIHKKNFIPTEEEIENNINSYYLAKWLSHDLRNIIVSETININSKNMNLHSQYFFSRACIYDVPFVKNPKKKLEFKDKEEEELYKIIKVHYNFGNSRDNEILEIMGILSSEEKEKLRKRYQGIL